MIELKDIINYPIGTRFLIRYIPYMKVDFWEFEIIDKEGENFKYKNIDGSEFWKNIKDLVIDLQYKFVQDIIVREN